jgi:prophage antirepressor-like protein
MNELKVFTNEECGEIRAMKRDGEAWFVAVDVCNALDIKNARQAVTRLDDDEKCTVISNDGRQMNIVSESGLYSLVLSSRKKEAKTFKRWITHEVLPEIRKTGGYNSQQTDSDKRLDMLDFVRIQELKLSGKEIAEFADSQLIARGLNPQHLSNHAKAEALYGDIVDMQLSRIMEARNKTIRDYMGFQHKELAPDSFTIESMSKEKMEQYHGMERLGVTLIIDGEEVAMEDEKEQNEENEQAEQSPEAKNGEESPSEDNNTSAAALEQNSAETTECADK